MEAVPVALDDGEAALGFGVGWGVARGVGWPNEDIHGVAISLVDEGGDTSLLEVIDSAADQRETFGGEVFHGNGKIDLAIEPRFNGVGIG